MSDAVALKVKIITGARDGPDLLVIGGVHGDEFESMAAIRRLIAAVDPLQLRGRLICIPVVNEPAYWRGQRTAEDELDLARTCPGRPDGSITERVAHAVSAHIRASNYLIDLHSGGLVMEFYPTVGYTLHPDPKILEAQRRMARALNMPIIWGTYPHLDGRTLSVARDAKVPAIYAEWMGGGVCDPAGVDAYCEGCLNVMAALDMLDREQPVSRSEHVVEDNRNNAGFVQLNYPAPFAGYFEPLVTLKARIAPGDPIGAVVDPLGDSLATILGSKYKIVRAVGFVLGLSYFENPSQYRLCRQRGDRLDHGRCRQPVLHHCPNDGHGPNAHFALPVDYENMFDTALPQTKEAE